MKLILNSELIVRRYNDMVYVYNPVLDEIFEITLNSWNEINSSRILSNGCQMIKRKDQHFLLDSGILVYE